MDDGDDGAARCVVRVWEREAAHRVVTSRRARTRHRRASVDERHERAFVGVVVGGGVVMEYVSFEGLRLDGRRFNECRRVRHEFAVDAAADGSCRLEMGNTVVQAVVYGPYERRTAIEEGASEACECEATYGASAFSTDGARAARRVDRRAQAHAAVLTKIVGEVVMVDLMPRCALSVRVTVLCDDGGARAASVNAAVLALADAGVPLRDTASAVTCGYLDGEVLVDLNRDEERGRGPELLLCAVGASASGDGEDAADDERLEEDLRSMEIIAEELERGKTTMETFDSMHDLALAATATIAAYMRGAALSRTKALASARALEKF